MAGTQFIEKQKILKYIRSIPYSSEDRQKWETRLEENEIDEAVLHELHDKLMEIPQDKFANDWIKAKYSMELKNLIQQWRMDTASKQFKRGR